METKYGVVCENSNYAIEWTLSDSPQLSYDRYLEGNPTANQRMGQWWVYKCVKVLYGLKLHKWAPVQAAAEEYGEAVAQQPTGQTQH